MIITKITSYRDQKHTISVKTSGIPSTILLPFGITGPCDEICFGNDLTISLQHPSKDDSVILSEDVKYEPLILWLKNRIDKYIQYQKDYHKEISYLIEDLIYVTPTVAADKART